MAKIKPSAPVQNLSGKLHHSDDGYFYVDNRGNQFYRHREETYQKNQSPRQKWNSAAFAYAHRELPIITSTPEGLKTIEQEYHAAGKMNPTGTKRYERAVDWKFAALQQEWKTAHPYDQWYANYVDSIQKVAEQKTSSGEVSKYMLERQIGLLTDQLITLREQLQKLK